MATLRVLSFDTEGRPIQFKTWLDDLQLFLMSDCNDNVSLFDHTSGASVSPPTTAELSALARYSSPATAELSRLMLPYPFLELSAVVIVAGLITHLRTSDTRLCAALRKEFLAKNRCPMHWTLHFIVTRLPDSLSSVRDHFLSRGSTELTVDLLEEHLLAAEKSIVALLTSLVLSLLVLLLHLVGGAAVASAREPRIAEVAPGGMVVEAVEEEEVVEGVVAGVLAGVVASVAAVEAVATEGLAAAVVAAVAAGAALAAAVEVLALARDSSSVTSR
ncbi:unnamed protein product [Closterium sp. Yama58-4]|nr:unnamed protein product [Closterium sp. Yama58-4]